MAEYSKATRQRQATEESALYQGTEVNDYDTFLAEEPEF